MRRERFEVRRGKTSHGLASPIDLVRNSQPIVAPTTRAEMTSLPSAARPTGLDELLRAWGLLRVPFSADEKSSELFATSAQVDALGAWTRRPPCAASCS